MLLQNSFREWEVCPIFFSGNCFLLGQQGIHNTVWKMFSCPFTRRQGVPNQVKM